MQLVEPELDPELEPELDPVVDPELDPELEPEPVVDPELDPVRDPEEDPELEPVVDPELDPELDPVLAPEEEPELEPVVDPELDPARPDDEPPLDPELPLEPEEPSPESGTPDPEPEPPLEAAPLDPAPEPELEPAEDPELPLSSPGNPRPSDEVLHAPASIAAPTTNATRPTSIRRPCFLSRLEGRGLRARRTVATRSRGQWEESGQSCHLGPQNAWATKRPTSAFPRKRSARTGGARFMLSSSPGSLSRASARRATHKGSMSTPLSVLDLSPVLSGGTAGEALRNSLDLARHAEALGLRRYWVAEHHNAGFLACPAPEILIGQVAAATRSIRVGSGGIMLPNHTPLKVAESFRVLHALFPGRVDLGLGRAPGTDPRTAAALRRSRAAVAADDFPERFDDLARYLDDDGPPRDALTGTVRAIPLHVPSPDLWLLGSSEAGGCLLAAQRGARIRFRPSHQSGGLRTRAAPLPGAVRAVGASPRAVGDPRFGRRLRRDGRRGAGAGALGRARDGPLPPGRARPPAAERRGGARARLRRARRALRVGRGEHVVVGGVERVGARLRELIAESGADEVMVVTHVHEHAARKRSYELVAEALRRER